MSRRSYYPNVGWMVERFVQCGALDAKNAKTLMEMGILGDERFRHRALGWMIDWDFVVMIGPDRLYCDIVRYRRWNFAYWVTIVGLLVLVLCMRFFW